MNEKPKGRLIMAGNSIGNLLDIPLRSLECVRTADLLLFEEHKIARQVLKAAKVTRDYLQYSEHEEKASLQEAEAALSGGKTVLYMSDQGMPNFADPGRGLLALAYKCGSKVEVIPGPSSFSAAIAACPYDCKTFLFYGFLPREQPERLKVLKGFKNLPFPILVFDTPYRLKALLADVAKVFEGQNRGFLALDIAGEKESYHEDTFKKLLALAEGLGEKLNFILMIRN